VPTSALLGATRAAAHADSLNSHETRRTGASGVRCHAVVDRAHSGGKAAPAGGDHRNPFGGAARRPTVGEFVPGYEASGWLGVGAPKNTPTEIVDILNKEINAGLAAPKMKARLADLGSTAVPLSPAEKAD
jgi:tripartite-type tricarboxylate transporter receptor subunit TctC